MGHIKVEETPIHGLYVVTPAVYQDGRGCFLETYNQREMAALGLDMAFVQDNQSVSVKGVLRGLHLQGRFPQGKLVRVAQGTVFDVAVDLRAGSPSLGRWFGLELSEANQKQLYIPEGFAHGFLALSERAVVCYKTTTFYHPEDERGLAWNDPGLGILWPGVIGPYTGTASAAGYRMEDGTALLLNQRDQSWPGLEEETHGVWGRQ